MNEAGVDGNVFSETEFLSEQCLGSVSLAVKKYNVSDRIIPQETERSVPNVRSDHR